MSNPDSKTFDVSYYDSFGGWEAYEGLTREAAWAEAKSLTANRYPVRVWSGEDVVWDNGITKADADYAVVLGRCPR